MAPSGECLRGKAQLIGLLAALGAVVSGSLPSLGYLVVAAVLRDSVCFIAALCGRLLCVMLYSLCKVEQIILTELNEDDDDDDAIICTTFTIILLLS